MSFHRTGGKGGTRNSPRERHADRFLPNFNKSRGSGKVARGRRVDNPGKGSANKDTPAQRYKKMMEGKRPRMTMGERWGSKRLGKSDVTGDYGY